MARNGNPRLSVFKGREAKLNRAIFLVLADESPLSIRQVCKKVRNFRDFRYTQYRVVNRRVKALQQEGYLKLVEVKITLQGFQSKQFELTSRAYLAFVLESVDFDALIQSKKEEKLITLLATILEVINV